MAMKGEQPDGPGGEPNAAYETAASSRENGR
jgi:hypothetical protein